MRKYEISEISEKYEKNEILFSVCENNFFFLFLFRKALSDWIQQEKGFKVFSYMVDDNHLDDDHHHLDDDDDWPDWYSKEAWF